MSKKKYLAPNQRIERVRTNGYKNLDLGRLQLTKVPESIFSLSTVIDIDLSKNNLRTLPDEFTQQNYIRVNLSNNSFTEFPSQLFEMEKIETLILEGNRIEKVPNEIRRLKN